MFCLLFSFVSVWIKETKKVCVVVSYISVSLYVQQWSYQDHEDNAIVRKRKKNTMYIRVTHIVKFTKLKEANDIPFSTTSLLITVFFEK